ncbi:MAG: ribonuclease H-like domain-containing protein [Planctomycetota bacterium]
MFIPAPPRRRWRRDVPNCRLQTLEAVLCGRHRRGDIPDAAIPEAYHDFVATGDARRMGDILHHNLLDLLTMAQLVSALLTGCARDQ